MTNVHRQHILLQMKKNPDKLCVSFEEKNYYSPHRIVSSSDQEWNSRINCTISRQTVRKCYEQQFSEKMYVVQMANSDDIRIYKMQQWPHWSGIQFDS